MVALSLCSEWVGSSQPAARRESMARVIHPHHLFPFSPFSVSHGQNGMVASASYSFKENQREYQVNQNDK